MCVWKYFSQQATKGCVDIQTSGEGAVMYKELTELCGDSKHCITSAIVLLEKAQANGNKHFDLPTY